MDLRYWFVLSEDNMSDTVAIYSRLSEEDRNKLNEDDESRSIQNQKSMLVTYAANQGWDIYNIYSDDDYKGSDRSRPAFNRLLEDARNHKFNIVLCKSQSRFTRELELVEKIIHGDFAEWGIRFVGLADNADTANQGNKKSRQINGLVNEWYLEDLSDNIKTVLTDHRKKGLHIGAFALYGYRKDPDRKGHLIIDPEAAAIVREVFELYASGIGRTGIARILNDRGIPNPTEYKRRKGLRYNGVDRPCGTLWKYYGISAMLENEMYIGNMVQGKYANPTYKSRHSKPVPKESWIRVEGTHEPIIDQELWERVQQRRKERAKPCYTGEIGIFAVKTKCMYCGYTLTSSKNRGYRYLKCPTRNLGSEVCKGAFIAQRLLEKAVLEELNRIISAHFDETSAELSVSRNLEAGKQRLKKEISNITIKMQSLKKAIQNMYIDKANGLISDEEYFEFHQNFSGQVEQCKKLRAKQEAELEALEAEGKSIRSREEILKKYKNVSRLDRDIMDSLIDYIEIGRCEKKVHRDDLPPIIIHWKF